LVLPVLDSHAEAKIDLMEVQLTIYSITGILGTRRDPLGFGRRRLSPAARSLLAKAPSHPLEAIVHEV
jgi:hypothetical protein